MDKVVYHQQSLRIHQKKHGPRLFIVGYFESLPDDFQGSLRFLEEQLLARLNQEKAVVIHERWFGSEEYLSLVKTAWAKADQPTQLHACVTAIDGKPCYSGNGKSCNGFSGIQIEAVIPGEKASHPEPITDKEGIIRGHQWKENGARFLMIQDMQDLGLSESRPRQTTEALRRAEALLQGQGLDYRSVARTWIYLDKILEWYTPFNEARSAFYRRVGIMPDIEKSEVTPARECYLPASTGIRGRNLSGAACTIDLIAAEIPEDSGFTVRRLTNRKQKDAFRYGAAFARASVTENSDYAEVQISGTASIDETGSSVCLGDTEAQIRRTMDTIETLISEAGFRLTDICSATAFIKHEKDLPLFLRIMEEKGLSDLPMVICKADVCRDELLFEMDGIAGREKKWA